MEPNLCRENTSLTTDFLWTASDGTRFPARKWVPNGRISVLRKRRGFAAHGFPIAPGRRDPPSAQNADAPVPDCAPFAQVLCVHGLGGSVGDFGPLGEHLAEQGVLSVAVTVRGQGLDPDPRRRGHFLEPGTIARDFAKVLEEMKQDLTGVPVFLCGESLGGLLAAEWLAHGRIQGIAGAIFSAPVVALARETPSLIRWGLQVLATFAPRGRLRPSWFVTGGAKPLPTSRDEAWLEAQRSGPHHIPAFTFRALDATGRLIRQVDALATGVQVPSLVLAAGKDVFVKSEQVRSWFDRLGAADKTFHEYPDAYHVLWNDLDRSHVLTDIATWILAHTTELASS